jgi:hypothetical protein
LNPSYELFSLLYLLSPRPILGAIRHGEIFHFGACEN